MAPKAEVVLARVDERINALHEVVVNEVRPALRVLTELTSTVTWLKLGVLGIYGVLGTMGVYMFQHILRR